MCHVGPFNRARRPLRKKATPRHRLIRPMTGPIQVASIQLGPSTMMVSPSNMKWAADPSCYKTASGSVSKCSTLRVKYLEPASSPSCPRDRPRDGGCGGPLRRRIISGRGRRRGCQGLYQGARGPTHLLDQVRNTSTQNHGPRPSGCSLWDGAMTPRTLESQALAASIRSSLARILGILARGN